MQTDQPLFSSRQQLFSIFIVLVLSVVTILSAHATELQSEAEARIRQLFNDDSRLTITPYQDELLEISLGANTFFATEDGRYLFGGPVLDTLSRQNIVELRAQEYRAKRIAGLSSDMYLSFAAKNEKQSVTLFTDIDCGYCRQFHTQIEAFNADGITINYVMLPRAGLNSNSYYKTLSVLCSKNPQHNMTLAMQGQNFKPKRCQTTLPKQLQLAQELGIQTTPSMILPDGGIKMGLISSKELNSMLAIKNQL